LRSASICACMLYRQYLPKFMFFSRATVLPRSYVTDVSGSVKAAIREKNVTQFVIRLHKYVYQTIWRHTLSSSVSIRHENADCKEFWVQDISLALGVTWSIPGLFNDVFCFIGYISSTCIVTMTLILKTWKGDNRVTYKCELGRIEIQGALPLWQPVSGSRFETWTSQIRDRNAKDLTAN